MTDGMRVLNAAQMREADRITIDEIGIRSLVLMECAGRQVVSTLQQRVEDRDRERQMIADPQRIVAAIVDELDQRRELVDRRPPWFAGRLGAAVDRLDADLEDIVERQGHASAFLAAGPSGKYARS